MSNKTTTTSESANQDFSIRKFKKAVTNNLEDTWSWHWMPYDPDLSHSVANLAEARFLQVTFQYHGGV